MTNPSPFSGGSESPGSALAEETDYPIYVVCVGDEHQPAGCLAGFATQCSIDPIRFLVCISKANHTYRVARDSPALSLHLLGSGQHDLAVVFGHLTGDDVDKFAHCDWRPGRTGVPVLQQCVAWAEGDIIDHRDVGDHVAFLMAPLHGGRGSAAAQLTSASVADIDAGHDAHVGSDPA